MSYSYCVYDKKNIKVKSIPVVTLAKAINMKDWKDQIWQGKKHTLISRGSKDHGRGAEYLG